MATRNVEAGSSRQCKRPQQSSPAKPKVAAKDTTVQARTEPSLPALTGGRILESLPFTPASVASLLGQKPVVSGIQPRAERITITPSTAERLLSSNVRNRSVSELQVAYLARELEGGRWIYNGAAIGFDREGILLDGQHRLEACIRAGLPFQTDVVFGLDPRAQLTIDTNRKRTNGDNLALMQIRNGNQIASSMRHIFFLAKGIRNYRVSTPEIVSILDRYPQLRESVNKVYASKVKGCNPPMLAALHFIISQALDQKQRADDFVKVFRSGVPDYSGDPTHKLREKVLEATLSHQPFSPLLISINVVAVWNLFAKKQRRQTLRLLTDLDAPIQIDGFNPKSLNLS